MWNYEVFLKVFNVKTFFLLTCIFEGFEHLKCLKPLETLENWKTSFDYETDHAQNIFNRVLSGHILTDYSLAIY